MSITYLGAIFSALTLLILVANRRAWLPWVLSASMPFVQTSGIIFGDNDIGPFFIAAVPALVWCVADALSGKRLRYAGFSVVVTVVFVASAVILPIIFEGTPVLVPRGGIDEQVMDPGTLAFSLSNLAQAGYFVLTVAVVLHIANNPPKRAHFLALGFGLGTALSVWALASTYAGIYFPQDFFRPTTAATYESFYGGAQRLRGIFAEPSYLATFSVAALAFFVFLFLRAQRGKVLIAAAVIANGAAAYFAYSGTAIAGIAVLAAVIVIVYGAGFLVRRVRIPSLAVVVGSVVAIPLILLIPAVLSYLVDFTSGKVGSSSGSNRDASNWFSLDILGDTYLLGAGLGSSRPSSFLLTLLSTVGVLGTVLYVIWVAKLLRPAAKSPEHHPELWATIAVIVCKLIAEPNPSNPIMILCLAAAAAAPALGTAAGGGPATGSRTRRSGALPTYPNERVSAILRQG